MLLNYEVSRPVQTCRQLAATIGRAAAPLWLSDGETIDCDGVAECIVREPDARQLARPLCSGQPFQASVQGDVDKALCWLGSRHPCLHPVSQIKYLISVITTSFAGRSGT